MKRNSLFLAIVATIVVIIAVSCLIVVGDSQKTEVENLYPIYDFKSTNRDYIVHYDGRTKNPCWVLEHLNGVVLRNVVDRRRSRFVTDPDAPVWMQTASQDYIRSGFDRGHMSPAEDNTSSQEAMDKCFLMTNISPQIPELNRGVWAHIEKLIRDKIDNKDWSECWVLTFPVYDGDHIEKMGNGTWVPTHFGKSVLGAMPNGNTTVMSWLVPNTKIATNGPQAYLITEHELESICGMDLWPNLNRRIR